MIAAEGIDKNKPDYRTTLYWKSDAPLKGEKDTPFSFYTGDKLADFLIFVEGITMEGQPFVEQKVLHIRKNAH